jgi:hypothetical protein
MRSPVPVLPADGFGAFLDRARRKIGEFKQHI